MRRFLIPALAVSWASMAVAQDRPNTILVMDGSGSMWGQIDGVAKITIAQDVVRDLLTSLPDSDRLGLTVYGHRERGNCTDIENVVAPGPNTRDAIATAVDEISPLGKTPMTDAVIAAAQALRYTEDSATVILVSDGVETCNPDPCAAARLLEQAGVDFTAHVIGFDVSGDAEALAQMQCIADETGGMFIPASDAGELSAALNTIVEDPDPVAVTGTFRAVLDDGTRIGEPILWDIVGPTGTVVKDQIGNPITAELLDGAYTATAYRLVNEVARDAAFTVSGTALTVDVVFPQITAPASLTAPAEAPVGSTISVDWDGPGSAEDFVGIGKVDGAQPWQNYFYTRDGNPGSLLMPTQPGLYNIQYFQAIGRDSIASTPILLTPVTATIDAPADAIIGSQITVGWTGPDYAEDFIGIGPVDATGAPQWQSYFYTNAGPSGQLTIPTEPGDYLIQYFFGQGQAPLMGVPITVTAVPATITAPDTAVAGTSVTVDWTGPGYENDYVGIGKAGETNANAWAYFAYTNDGSPVTLKVPAEPGAYEIKYFLGQDRSALASHPITVTGVLASLTAPPEAVAGSSITVTWVGPNYDSDYIGMGKAGLTNANAWESSAYTRDGNPVVLKVPTEPGAYEIKYFLGQDRSFLASVPVTVTPVSATLTAPAEVVAGAAFEVTWTGPDYDRDYIGIGPADARGQNLWENYAYTKEGTPAMMLAPTTTGPHIVSYFLGQDRAQLAFVPINVTPVSVTLQAPARAPAGSEITVNWTGPDYNRDYIGVGPQGASGANAWDSYRYTRDGADLTLTLPDAPGDYAITYFIGQDRTAVTSVPIKLD